jgi:hypothetical protein
MKNLIFTLLLAGISLIALAQHPPHRHKPSPEQFEKMKAHKVAFITNELNLTSKEAQTFWPIYNEFEDSLHKLREENRKGRDKGKIDEMSDTEIEKTIDNHFSFRQQELDLEKEYSVKFKAVLPIKKVAKLHRVEQKFHKELILKLGNKKQEKPQEGRPEGPRN